LTLTTEIDLFCKMADEEFVPIHGFERYAISKSGNIMNIKTGRIMSQHINVHTKTGYKSVKVKLVNDDGVQTYCTVSRLLAKAFIPNPEGKRTVDHIDRNSLNNDLTNLCWATQSEQALNQHHALGSSGHKYIYKNGNGWQISIPRLKISKYFKTIDGALAARAIFLPEEST
jgi:hypothetical protein